MIRNVLKRAGGERSKKAKSPAQTGTGAQRQYTEGGSGKWIPFASFCTTGQFMKLDQEPGKIRRPKCRQICRSKRRPECWPTHRPQCNPQCRPVCRPEYRSIPWPQCRQVRRPISRQRKKCCSREQRQDGPRESFSDVRGDWTTDTYLLEHKNPWTFRGNL